MFRLSSLLAHTLAGSYLWLAVAGVRSPGNTTCASSQLDWYSDVVGETPCATYQRLRQICNPDYKVSQFRSQTPGDNCDDQLSSCCCNSVSWALSMLCMNCQVDADGGNIGLDAGSGAYGLYSSTCGGKPLNKTLPNDIQTAVCNREIKIDRNLYSLFWGDGSWFYIYTKQTMTKDFAVTNNNTFTHCNSTLRVSTTLDTASQTASSLSTSATGSPADDTGSTTHSTSIAPIVGGVVGGVLGAVGLVVLGFVIYRTTRQRRGPTPLDLSKEYGASPSYSDDLPTAAITPFSAASTQSNSGYGGGKPQSEEFALLPRGHTSPGGEKLAGPWDSTHSLASGEGERHEDAGPVPALQRSQSGRLPPAYRQSWDASEVSPADAPPYVPPLPMGSVAETEGGSSAGSGSTVTERSAAERPRARDVKRFPMS